MGIEPVERRKKRRSERQGIRRRADAPVDEEVAKDEGLSGLRMSSIPKKYCD